MAEKGTKIIMTDHGPVASSVELGRDSATRPFKSESGKSDDRKYQCCCCGAFTLNAVDVCNICPECGWEDWYECHDEPNTAKRPNRIGLCSARDIFRRFGPGAVFQINRAGGLTIQQVEAMSVEERARLKTPREEVDADHA